MILDYLGKFHPLLVHLPIGMVALALVFKLMSRVDKWTSLKEVLPLVLLLSFASALLTSITGYLLSRAGGYDSTLLERHQWSAITLTIVLGLMTILTRKGIGPFFENLLWVVLGLLLTAAGHLGGSLTHGEDFLSFTSSAYQRPLIIRAEEAHIFNDLVAPVFAENCFACHSSRKQKAQLRLDKPAHILKGSKEGLVLHPGKPLESLLVKNMLLPEFEEQHMPPRGRPQPSEEDIELIRWWVEIGAPFELQLIDAPENERIARYVQDIVNDQAVTATRWIPEEEIGAAPREVIQQLTDKGLVVVPVAANSNYLSINMLEKPFEEFSTLLAPISEHIVWVRAANTGITDKDLIQMGNWKNLRILHIGKNPIGDSGIEHLANLKDLHRLTLTSTNVSASGIQQLSGLTNLRQLYLWNSRVEGDELATLQRLFPEATLDLGRYETIISDVDTSSL